MKREHPIKPITFINFSPPNLVVITYYMKAKKLPPTANNLKNEIKNILEGAFPETKVKIELKI